MGIEGSLLSSEAFPMGIAGVAIVIGLLFCFFGKKLFKTLCALVGAIIFASIALAVTHVVLMFYKAENPLVCYAIAGIIAAVIGGFMGIKTCELLVCISVSSVMAFAIYGLGMGILPALIAFFVGFILAYILLEKILIVITAFAGALAVAMGVFTILRLYPVAVAIIVILTILGVHIQRKMDED